jgi:hypothetical protein
VLKLNQIAELCAGFLQYNRPILMIIADFNFHTTDNCADSEYTYLVQPWKTQSKTR